MKYSPTAERPEMTLIVGILIICGSFFSWLEDSDIHQSELTEITGTLKRRPFLKHSQIKGANYYDYDFNLREYECTFRISDDEYRSLKLDLIENEVRVGDTISLYIFKDDVRYSHSAIEKITTYGISKNQQKLYDLEFRNQRVRNDKNALWFFIGFGIIVCLYAVVQNVYIVYWIAGAYAFSCFLFVMLFIMP